MAVLSKGIKLSYKAGESSEYIELADLQEIPELGGDTEAVEITTLSDGAHMYMDGLKNYGDSLAFKFLYKKEQFKTLDGLKEKVAWKVDLPDGASCTFSGTGSVKLGGATTNTALTYTLAIKPSTEMVWA